MSDFEENVLLGLKSCVGEGASREKICSPLAENAHREGGLQDLALQGEKNPLRLGVAVSGGADSVSLLISLCHILSPLGLTLEVITINHNIRPKEETAGDAFFVQSLCQKLNGDGYRVNCSVVELPPGAVADLVKNRKSGVEEAARFLRYQAFDRFILEKNLDFLCLAHNQNDQIETMLMRFLQGASVEALGGIARARGKYIRPLLGIKRSEIEDYLTGQNISWRTDKTNFDAQYLRNKIRLKLLPFLEENFPGFQSALLKGSERYFCDGDFIRKSVEDFPLAVKNDCVQISLSDFNGLAQSQKIRVILRAGNLLGEEGRIPYQFIKDFLKGLDDCLGRKNSRGQERSLGAGNCLGSGREKSLGAGNHLGGENPRGLENHLGRGFRKVFGQLEISYEKSSIFVKKFCKSQTDLVFFDIIEESGLFQFPFGQLIVYESECQGEKSLSLCINGQVLPLKLHFPFIVRSPRLGDEIESADGKMKSLSDIFNDWKVSDADKNLLPVIQNLDCSEQKIVCLAGSFLGYKDWIVKL